MNAVLWEFGNHKNSTRLSCVDCQAGKIALGLQLEKQKVHSFCRKKGRGLSGKGVFKIQGFKRLSFFFD